MEDDYAVLDPSRRAELRSGSCALAVMAKAPQVGAVKTRLTPPLRADEAAKLNQCFLKDVGALIAELCTHGAADGYAAYTPRGQEAAFRGLLPPGFCLLPQRGTHLGERLLHAAEDFFSVGYHSMCLINSDSPTMPPHLLAHAVAALRKPGDRVVLGPADDGGYYLIGLKRAHRRLFEDIPWSTATVLSRTLERAAEIALSVELLPTWYDVDDFASLSRLCLDLFRNGGSARAPHTREYLRTLIEDGGSERLGFTLSAGACSV